MKQEILNRLCYTELVYGRICKKLRCEMTRAQIEAFMYHAIEKSDKIETIGKNFYVNNIELNLRITINSFTMRVITADRITK